MAKQGMKISIQNKFFQNNHVLGSIDFDLKAGETTTLFGPSGCGKTTLLRIMSGLDCEVNGHVSLNQGRLGFVFQEPRLLPWRTVWENVALVAPNHPERVKQLLEEVGLLDSAPVLAAKLSLGMARRVALARALVIDPEVLILDEPFASLDNERAAQLRLLILDLSERHNLTLLLVTHDLFEAVQLTQRILVLDGKPSEIKFELPIKLTPTQRRDTGIVFHQTEHVREKLDNL